MRCNLQTAAIRTDMELDEEARRADAVPEYDVGTSTAAKRQVDPLIPTEQLGQRGSKRCDLS